MVSIERRSNVILFLTMFSSAISQSFIFAIMPGVGREIGFSDVQVGELSSLPAVLYVVSAPFFGHFVERYGHGLFIKGGLACGIVTNLAFGVIVEFSLRGSIDADLAFNSLLASRLLLNLAWGGMFPAVQSYVAQNTTSEGRVGGMSLLAGSSGLGLVAGPAIPLALSSFGASASFYFVSVLTLLSFVFAFLLPKVGRAGELTKTAPPTGTLPQHLIRCAPFFACAFLVLSALTGIQQLAAFQVQDTLMRSAAESSETAGGLLSVMAASTLVAQWFVASRGIKLEPTLLLTGGGAIGCLGIGFIMTSVVTSDFPLILVGFALFGFASGFILPANAAGLSLAVPSNFQGRMAGLLGSAQGAGRIVGPVLSTSLYGSSKLLPYWSLIGALLVVTMIGMLLHFRPRTFPQSSD